MLGENRKSKSEIVETAITQMEHELPSYDLSLKEKVALTCKILFHFGHDSGLSGQITARNDNSSYWTQRLGYGFDETDKENLLLVSDELEVLEGAGMPNPANRFHSWIYKEKPEVNCIVHSHPLYVSALSMLGVPLELAHMDTCPLYGRMAFLKDWPGIPVGDEEGEIISSALGDNKAILLAHHGLVVAGASVEEACVLGVLIERAARLQLMAMSAGTIKPIPDELGKEAQSWTSTPKRISATFAYYARRVSRE